MSKEQEYKDGIKTCGISVGDVVRVVRKAASREAGWNNTWTGIMSDSIGKTFTVLESDTGAGFQLDDEDQLRYPHFVLSKVDLEGYETRPITDFISEKCHPVIREHLGRGRAILCYVSDEDENLMERQDMVITWEEDSDFPYVTKCSRYCYATPVCRGKSEVIIDGLRYEVDEGTLCCIKRLLK